MTKRILVFVYGSVSYLVFLATFLYAIAFIGGFVVPTRLDGPSTRVPGRRAGRQRRHCSTLFAVQHSVMARKWFKDAWTRVVPAAAERSTYVLFSSLALILLFWQWRPMGGVVWSVEDPAARFVLYGLFAFGWALVLACTFFINHFDLFGLRQIWLYPHREALHRAALRDAGRRTGWSAIRSTSAGSSRSGPRPTMTVAHLVFAVATTAYILVAIQLEERDLVREHGSTLRAVPAGGADARPVAARPRGGNAQGGGSALRYARSLPVSAPDVRRRVRKPC